MAQMRAIAPSQSVPITIRLPNSIPRKQLTRRGVTDVPNEVTSAFRTPDASSEVARISHRKSDEADFEVEALAERVHHEIGGRALKPNAQVHRD